MKIIGFIDSLGSGGAQRQMVLLLRGLVERGHNVTIANYYPHLDHFRQELAEICPIIDFPKQSRWSIKPALALRCLLKKSPPDILLSFLDTPNIYAILAGIGIKSTKVVVSERFTFKSDTPNFAERVRYLFYRGADAITVNSEHQKTNIQQYFPNLSYKVSRIYNGVDLKHFTPPNEYINWDERPLKLLAVGSIAAKKNPINLVKALSILSNRGISVSVSWVGTKIVSGEGKETFDQCNNLLAQLNINKNWEWLGERNDVPELMRSYHALVHPSFKEGFPNVVCEALTSGLPVLASSIGDHPYLVEQGSRGFLFNPEDKHSIADAISTLYYLKTEDAALIRNACRTFAKSELDTAKLAENYEKLFLELIDRSHVEC